MKKLSILLAAALITVSAAAFAGCAPADTEGTSSTTSSEVSSEASSEVSSEESSDTVESVTAKGKIQNATMNTFELVTETETMTILTDDNTDVEVEGGITDGIEVVVTYTIDGDSMVASSIK